MGRSFDDAFSAEFASLHGYLARRLGASAADDLAAETFAVALRNWDRLDPERPVRPWLYGIAANLMRHTTGARSGACSARTRAPASTRCSRMRTSCPDDQPRSGAT
jgi:predicted RNA polymerase sigma factor